jgi:hypothetical protein
LATLFTRESRTSFTESDEQKVHDDQQKQLPILLPGITEKYGHNSTVTEGHITVLFSSGKMFIVTTEPTKTKSEMLRSKMFMTDQQKQYNKMLMADH